MNLNLLILNKTVDIVSTKECKITMSSLQDYKNCLENNENNYIVNYSFRSNKHEIILVKQKKIALNTFDDKSCYIDKYISVPWGYNPSS